MASQKTGVFDHLPFIMIILGTQLFRHKTFSKVLESERRSHTHVLDTKADDIFRSFFKASVSELEASTDLALAEVLYRVAWRDQIRF